MLGISRSSLYYQPDSRILTHLFTDLRPRAYIADRKTRYRREPSRLRVFLVDQQRALKSRIDALVDTPASEAACKVSFQPCLDGPGLMDWSLPSSYNNLLLGHGERSQRGKLAR